jgi:hypothetical protein
MVGRFTTTTVGEKRILAIDPGFRSGCKWLRWGERKRRFIRNMSIARNGHGDERSMVAVLQGGTIAEWNSTRNRILHQENEKISEPRFWAGASVYSVQLR